MRESRNLPVRSGVRARRVFLREAVSEGAPVIYACGGALSLAVGWTLVGVLDLPLPWAVVVVVLVFALIVFEGAYRMNARLREAQASLNASGPHRPERLADECREFAKDLEIFADERRHEPAVKSNTMTGNWRMLPARPGDASTDDGGHAALSTFRAETLRRYQERFRRTGAELLDRVAEIATVDSYDRDRLADPQSVDEVAAIADMFRRFAVELTPLPERIEALVREGFRVQEFIQSGLIPSNGKPSEKAVERANDFRARCTALMREAGSTALDGFETAGNAYRRENGGERTTRDIREAFAGMAWDGLLIDVQANMCGLEAAQRELGRLADRQLASRSRAS